LSSAEVIANIERSRATEAITHAAMKSVKRDDAADDERRDRREEPRVCDARDVMHRGEQRDERVK
jgi:hypothetical protein